VTRNLEVKEVKSQEASVRLEMKARFDSELGLRPVWVKGEALVEGATITQYSRTVPLRISAIPFVLSTTLKRLSVVALPAQSDSAAREAVFSVKANRRDGFSGEIVLAVEGAPEGIEVVAGKIPENGNETEIKLVAGEAAPAGKEFTITVRGTGLFRDRNFRHAPEPLQLKVNFPEAEETVAQAPGGG
jgi:hypothetical protein